MIKEILDQLTETNKRTDKETILLQNKDNTLLKKVFWAAYTSEHNFWIISQPTVNEFNESLDLNTAIDNLLEVIARREKTGKVAIEYYSELLSKLSTEDCIVLRRIVDRDLRCGVSVATVNKVWKDLIPTFPIMLADNKKESLKFPDVGCQIKYDGLRIEIGHSDLGIITIRTRSGAYINSLEKLYPQLKSIVPIGKRFDGEMVCYKGDTPLSRKVSNGIVNKALKGTITEKEIDLIKFITWDIVDTTSAIPYIDRFNTLKMILSQAKQDLVLLADLIIVKDMESLEQQFNKAIAEGHEGVIAKNLYSYWVPKRSSDLCKFKEELTGDFKVIDWNEGTGKNVGLLGALVCTTEDNLIRFNVGSGFSDEQRKELPKQGIIGKVVEVKYNAKITNAKNDQLSLYLPRFICVREDKTTANTADELK